VGGRRKENAGTSYNIGPFGALGGHEERETLPVKHKGASKHLTGGRPPFGSEGGTTGVSIWRRQKGGKKTRMPLKSPRPEGENDTCKVERRTVAIKKQAKTFW